MMKPHHVLPALVLLADLAAAAPPDRLHALASELRCPVCQNQTLADSNADLARDLKEEIRKQIAQGRSDADIRDFMVRRYGDFVLYQPPLRADTTVLWVGPFALLTMGAGWLAWYMTRRREPAGRQTLGPANPTVTEVNE
ncbi:MAG: cytochrome C biogenesis protein [Leptothrix sp. (in: Bacteria)]|nr:cytochrome C biogenesis protein [Leptothrix sp. (in: b-proteobacteria)]